MSQIAPEPYELGYAADLKRLLGEIRTANGYHTEAGENVFLGDEKLDPSDELDIALIVVDPEEELVRQNGYTRDVNLRFDVEIFVRIGREPNARELARIAARRVLTDVRRAVLQGTKGNSWTTLPIDVTLEGRSLPPVEAGSNWQIGIQPVILYVREEFQGL